MVLRVVPSFRLGGHKGIDCAKTYRALLSGSGSIFKGEDRGCLGFGLRRTHHHHLQRKRPRRSEAESTNDHAKKREPLRGVEGMREGVTGRERRASMCAAASAWRGMIEGTLRTSPSASQTSTAIQ